MRGEGLPAARPTEARRGRIHPETGLALAFVAPTVLVVGGVYLYPAILTLLFSFGRVDAATFDIERFVGLSNFALVFRSEEIRGVLFQTIYFGVAVVLLTFVLSFLIALLLDQRFRGRGLLRVVVLLPWALPPVVSGVLWGQMFHADFGFVNGVIRVFGGDGDVVWLGHPTLALHAIIAAEVWRWIPFATLFLLAGLQTLPHSVYEAAAVDGANAWKRFRYLTLPLMWPIALPVMIFLFVWAMKAFDTIFVLTRGGPQMATTTLNYLVYQQAFEQFRLGDAAATAYVLSLVTLAVIVPLVLLQRRSRLRGWSDAQ